MVVQICFSVEEESIHGIVIEFPCLGSALACTTSTGNSGLGWLEIQSKSEFEGVLIVKKDQDSVLV